MFGLDQNIVEKVDYNLTLKRIINDVQGDFIYAPHINAVYALAQEELWNNLSSKLISKNFDSSLPITIEIPKPTGFTRPGSILMPYDRMSYQLAIDNIGPDAEKLIDRKKVFSNVLLSRDPKGLMFKSSAKCFNSFSRNIIKYAKKKSYRYVLKADIASYFQNIDQHVLINLLKSSGSKELVVSFLEKLLSSFSEKRSKGIIQGVFPSDFLGNFYLCSLDGECDLNKIPFVRYVDDIYLFFNSWEKAFSNKIKLIKWLRKEGLQLNELKTAILSSEVLLREETKIQMMFKKAKDEIESELEEKFEEEARQELGDFYSSTIQWDFLPSGITRPEIDYGEVDIDATKKLFDFEEEDRSARDKIDKFCIPVFAKIKDSYAIEYVFGEYLERQEMAQVFAGYIGKMIGLDPGYGTKTEGLLCDKNIFFDYQYMWLYAALMGAEKVKKTTVNFSINQLRDGNLPAALRAICAIFIGKFGNTIQKKLLRNHYSDEQSDYVCSAILYASQYFSSSEKSACYRAWGGKSELNKLILCAIRKI